VGPRGLEVLVKKKTLDHPVCSIATILTVLPRDSTVMTFIYLLVVYLMTLSLALNMYKGGILCRPLNCVVKGVKYIVYCVI
jgi:hypothetical protein